MASSIGITESVRRFSAGMAVFEDKTLEEMQAKHKIKLLTTRFNIASLYLINLCLCHSRGAL